MGAVSVSGDLIPHCGDPWSFALWLVCSDSRQPLLQVINGAYVDAKLVSDGW